MRRAGCMQHADHGLPCSRVFVRCVGECTERTFSRPIITITLSKYINIHKKSTTTTIWCGTTTLASVVRATLVDPGHPDVRRRQAPVSSHAIVSLGRPASQIGRERMGGPDHPCGTASEPTSGAWCMNRRAIRLGVLSVNRQHDTYMPNIKTKPRRGGSLPAPKTWRSANIRARLSQTGRPPPRRS